MKSTVSLALKASPLTSKPSLGLASRLGSPVASSVRPHSALPSQPSQASNALSRQPTKSLLRSLVLGFFFTSPLLYRPGVFLLQSINASQSPLLDPDSNPLLRRLVKPLIYDQFCGGVNPAEVRRTAAGIKHLGFSGVILAYSKEIEPDSCNGNAIGGMDDEIRQWKSGTMMSLQALDRDNWLGIKLTGAGNGVVQALKQKAPIPAPLREALEEICAVSKARGVRIYIDAEKQAVQTAIEQWTVDLMRQWNTGADTVVYTTLQSYLKSGRNTLERQARAAQEEGWNLGVKLVRGAYMAYEDRSCVHDTKAQTDQAFDGMVRDLIDCTVVRDVQDEKPVKLLIASHNKPSVLAALHRAQELHACGALRAMPEFAQLQGMADDVGHAIIDFADAGAEKGSTLDPRVYKLLNWGSVRECMLYLLRRAVENRDAAGRMRQERGRILRELWRRTLESFASR